MTANEYLAEWLQLQRVHLQPTTWNSYRQTIDWANQSLSPLDHHSGTRSSAISSGFGTGRGAGWSGRPLLAGRDPS